MNPRFLPLLGARSVFVVLGLVAGCKADTKAIGVMPARSRPAPLSPATRAELQMRGAVCTPNPTGPTLCTWTSPNGDVTCRMTFDTLDQLTDLTCDLDGLTWACRRPGDLFVCTWSDDPDCGDVYSTRGVFEAYLCGDELQARIHGRPDSGISRPDVGSRFDVGPRPEAGTRFDSGSRFEAGVALDAAIPPRDAGPNGCDQLDEQSCRQSRACHPVYLPSDICGCAPIGCCILFDHCAAGRQADCSSETLACRRLPPACGPRYIVSYADNCYEGCVTVDECAQTSEIQCTAGRFPSFDNVCQDVSECSTAIHQINCCGTKSAYGINFREVRRFTDDEAICRLEYPACGCAQGPTTAEDGQSTFDESTIGVDCVRGHCRTFVP